VTALRIETDLDKVEQNTRILVDRLASTGIRVNRDQPRPCWARPKSEQRCSAVEHAASVTPGCRTSLGWLGWTDHRYAR